MYRDTRIMVYEHFVQRSGKIMIGYEYAIENKNKKSNANRWLIVSKYSGFKLIIRTIIKEMV